MVKEKLPIARKLLVAKITEDDTGRAKGWTGGGPHALTFSSTSAKMVRMCLLCDVYSLVRDVDCVTRAGDACNYSHAPLFSATLKGIPFSGATKESVTEGSVFTNNILANLRMRTKAPTPMYECMYTSKTHAHATQSSPPSIPCTWPSRETRRI